LLSTHKERPDLERELQLSDADAADGLVTDSFLPLMVKERGGLLFLLLLSRLSAEVTQSGSSFPGGANKASVFPPPAPPPFLFLSGPIRFSLSLSLSLSVPLTLLQSWSQTLRLQTDLERTDETVPDIDLD
jgi:hypothetical protein